MLCASITVELPEERARRARHRARRRRTYLEHEGIDPAAGENGRSGRGGSSCRSQHWFATEGGTPKRSYFKDAFK